jgi:hypothetical protein
MKIFTAILLTLLFCLSKQAFCEPIITSIEGTPTHSGIIKINGTNFGTKIPAAPVKYDDFEDGNAGNDLSGWSFSTSSGDNPEYSTRFLRPNSAMSAVSIFESYLSSFGAKDMSNGFEKVYLDAWYLYDPASPPSRNHKLFRLYAGEKSGQPNLYFNVYCGKNGSSHLDQDGVSGHQWFDWHWADAEKSWVHIQGYFKASSPGVGDGTVRICVDNTLYIDEQGTWKTRETGGSLWHSIWFGNYLGHDAAAGCTASPGNSYTFWDNVYVDRTQARVEIGNSPNYNSCTHREIQIPVAWSSSSITVRMNQGSFSENDRAYVFAVDAEGNVTSPGYPITIDGDVPTDDPPSSPTGLSITTTQE